MKHFILMTIITLFIGCGSTSKKDTPSVPVPQQAPDTAEAVFTIGDDQNMLEGSSVKLSASMLDKTKELSRYSWKVDGKILSTSDEFTAKDLPAGEHYISLEATDKDGNVYKDTVVVVIKKETTFNKQPVAKNLTFNLKEDKHFLGSLGGSDADGDELSYLFVAFPQHGKLSGSAANLRYTPDANYNGMDSFIYKTNDGVIDSEYATVSIEIEAVNDAPVGVVDTVSTPEDTPLIVNVLANDGDVENELLTIATATQPANGTVQIIANNISYTPNPNFHGTDTFTYQPKDGWENGIAVVVTVTVVSVNDIPEFTSSPILTANEDSPYSYNLTIDDTESDNVNLILVKAPSWLTLTGATLSGTPKNADVGVYAIILSVNDDIATITQEFNITVTNINDAPIAHHDSNTTNEDTNITFNILSNDTDVDNGAILTLVGINFTEANATFTPNGNLTFSPIGYFDTLTQDEEHNVTLTYAIKDEFNATSKSNVTITIIGINNPPTISAINSINIDENTTTGTGQIIAHDVDNSSLTFESNSTLISIDSNGTYTFNTNGDYNNLAEGQQKIIPIMISISDGANSITQEINVTIIGVNTAPTVEIGGDYNITENESISFGITSSGDVDGSITKYSWKIDASEVETADSFSHNFTSAGTYAVTLTVTDDKNATASDTLSVTVIPVDTGEITFSKSTIATATNASSFQMADLDKDGDLDILAISTTAVFWYENSGDGNFILHDIESSSSINTVYAADINADGYLDVIYAGDSAKLCINNKDKTFTCSASLKKSIMMLTDDITSITVGDIDGVNGVDIIVTSRENDRVEAYLQKNDGTFDTSSYNEIGTGVTDAISVDSTDFDSDGDIDIVVAASNGIRYYKNNDNDGAFTTDDISDSTAALSVSKANINNIGGIDIISAYAGEIRWSAVSLSTLFKGAIDDNITNPSFASGVDMDDDGDTDALSSSNEANGKIVWYENNVTPLAPNAFTKHVIADNMTNITITQSGDMDNDGDIDVVSADALGNIYIFKNNTPVKTKRIAAVSDGNFTRDSATDTVKDNTTGLTWKDDTSVSSQKMTWTEAMGYCQNEWRLPNAQELLTITNKSLSPAINNTFENKNTEYYWTSTASQQSTNNAWIVNFYLGNDNHEIAKTLEYYVRCTKGTPLQNIFVRDDSKKVVLDRQHNLMWQDDNITQATWSDASGNCEALNFAGFFDWRLPNINELYTIGDRSKPFAEVAIKDAFSVKIADFFWASDTEVTTDKGYEVHFKEGNDGYQTKTDNNYCRCVRDIL